ncbi:MAG: ABC transporter permease subunit, partial [Candidatus Riflebacteria bacterium]|nr:ABC transporter permease subunit [Candidatus Riflebacteria bacterium]
MSAVVWKEWRENRLGLLVFVFCGLVMQSWLAQDPGHPDLPVILTMMFFIPAYVAMAGASTIAPEVGERTLVFLLSRPISRWRIWLAKTVSAALFAGLASVTLLCVSILVAPASWSHSVRMLGQIQLSDGVVVLVLLFSTSVFTSTLFDRTMPGFFAAILLAAAFELVIGMTDLVAVFAPAHLVASAVLLTTSLAIFCWGELLSGVRKYAWAVLGLLSLVIAIYGGATAFALAVRSVPVGQPDSLFSACLTPDRASLLVSIEDRALGQERFTPQLLDLATGSRKGAGASYLHPLAALPDGSGYLALDWSNCAGLKGSKGQSLELVTYDGRTVRLDERSYGRRVGIVRFSPDKRRALFDESLMVSEDGKNRWLTQLSLVDLPTRTYEVLFTTQLNGISQFGWSRDGGFVRFFKNVEPGTGQHQLWQLDVKGAKAPRVLSMRLMPGRADVGPASPPLNLHRAEYRMLPHRDELVGTIVGDKGSPSTLLLLEPTTGRAIWSLATGSTTRGIISADGRYLVNASCRKLGDPVTCPQ